MFFRRQSYFSLISLLLWVLVVISALYLVMWFTLPDVHLLEKTPLQAPMQIYTHDHKLVAEFGEKQRIPVAYEEVPQDLIWAIVATEDRRFFEHGGVDFRSILRAAVAVARSGERSQGASTITMQVARNFYLTRKKTITRKLKEILLAIKIDRSLSKEKILELYCNKVFFGNRSYGVGAAARNYYGKSLDQLTLAQMAMIAGLPQAPSRLNPTKNPDKALKRRSHVLLKMREADKITEEAFDEAMASPVSATRHRANIAFRAPYLAEYVRREIQDRYGKESINAGYKVIMTASSQDQAQAQASLRKGLFAYDYRHGYYPSTKRLPIVAYRAWHELLADYQPQMGLIPAVVMRVSAYNASIRLADGSIHALADKSLQWARYRSHKGGFLKEPLDLVTILHPGDVVWLDERQDGYHLRQLPQVRGALVSLNPKTGAVLAMVGGLSERSGGFNRATQAWRQPGSGFKPFIYASALAAQHLDAPYTLASRIEDNPIVVAQAGEANELWRPENDTRQFYGALTLRQSLMRSNNLITVRLLRDLGVDYVHNYIQRFGFDGDKHPKSLSLALGAGVVTPLQLTGAYATFANGGKQVAPYLIDRIIDQNGNVLFDHDKWSRPPMRSVLQATWPVLSPEVAFLIDSSLKSVILRGTGRGALSLHRKDLAGKTGTTNDLVDAWFVGYQPSVLTGVWVGFDDNRSLHEYGARSALPIWVDFMGRALKGKPNEVKGPPENIVMAWVNKGQSDAFVEYFVEGTQPTESTQNKPSAQLDELF